MSNRLMMRSFLIALCCCATGAADQFVPPQIKGVGIDQRIGDDVPLDTEFVDENSVPHRLSDYLDGRPAILVLVYYKCPMLCNLELNALSKAVRVLPLR